MRSAKINLSKDQSIFVIGSIYNIDKLYDIQNFIDNNKPNKIIMQGDIFHPQDELVNSKIEKIIEFCDKNHIYYILGDKDIIYLNKHKEDYKWFDSQNNIIKFIFENQTSVIVLHGGILKTHENWENVVNDLEISFISNIENNKIPWHHSYDGKFGYAISNHPNNKEIKKFNNSMSLDCSLSSDGKIGIVEFSEKGIKNTWHI